MKKIIFILSCLSSVSIWAHGYNPGRLEDAVTKADQAVIAKITAIQETPIYHKLGDGTQGPLLTTQRDYTLDSVSRVAREKLDLLNRKKGEIITPPQR